MCLVVKLCFTARLCNLEDYENENDLIIYGLFDHLYEKAEKRRNIGFFIGSLLISIALWKIANATTNMYQDYINRQELALTGVYTGSAPNPLEEAMGTNLHKNINTAVSIVDFFIPDKNDAKKLLNSAGMEAMIGFVKRNGDEFASNTKKIVNLADETVDTAGNLLKKSDNLIDDVASTAKKGFSSGGLESFKGYKPKQGERTLEGYAKGSTSGGLESFKGYKPKPGERTLRSYADSSVNASKFEEVFGVADNYNLSTDRFENHIERFHGHGSTRPDKSKFNESFDIKKGIDSTLKGSYSIVKPNTQDRGGYIFEKTFKNQIGTNTNGRQINTLRVVTDSYGNVVTAFPVR